jgi:acetolactate synthase-1/2/3 large subunit
MQGNEPDLNFHASLGEGFKQIGANYGLLGGNPHIRWLEEARERSRRFRSRWIEEPVASTPATGRHVVDAIKPFLGDDVVFLIDGGNIGQWAHMALANDRYPGYWLTCGISGVVGWGLPGAIAAKFAFPNKRILLLSGDGSFGFTVAELEIAVRYKLPFVAIVANDACWGIAACFQKKILGSEGVIASRTSPIRYDKVAEAFGAVGVEIEDSSELQSVILKGFSSQKPTIINVPVSLAGPYPMD